MIANVWVAVSYIIIIRSAITRIGAGIEADFDLEAIVIVVAIAATAIVRIPNTVLGILADQALDLAVVDIAANVLIIAVAVVFITAAVIAGVVIIDAAAVITAVIRAIRLVCARH